ncbi:MAG: hypothetical protein R2857_12570 [Vampirovibrionales bacterium]
MQPNKAIVGKNAFAHESGIHQDGFLKGRETYEIMHPNDVGVTQSVLPLGPRSGRAALNDRLKQLGFEADEAQLGELFDAFKRLADEIKWVQDDDITKLAQAMLTTPTPTGSCHQLALLPGNPTRAHKR